MNLKYKYGDSPLTFIRYEKPNLKDFFLLLELWVQETGLMETQLAVLRSIAVEPPKGLCLLVLTPDGQYRFIDYSAVFFFFDVEQ